MLEFLLHHKFEDIFVHKLKYEIQLVVVFDDLVKLDYVGVMEFFEDLDLIEVDAFFPVGVLLFHLFDGYDLFGLFVYGLDDRAETAVAQSLA